MLHRIFAVALLSCGAAAVHEAVVDKILTKVVEDMKKADPTLPEFTYAFKQNFGPVETNFRIYLSTGNMVVTGLKLNGEAQYKVPEAEGPAGFNFTADLEVFIAYKYSATGAGSPISFGTVAGNLVGPLHIEMDVEPTGCRLKINRMTRGIGRFDAKIDPKEGLFYPLAIHFPPGDVLETLIQPSLSQILTSSFNDRKVCDCIECNE